MSETITVWVCSCGHWGKYRTSHQDDDSHTQREIEYVRALDGAVSEVEHREGMVEVYDWNGRYVGCMGIERWNALLADDAKARRRGEPCFYPAKPAGTTGQEGT